MAYTRGNTPFIVILKPYYTVTASCEFFVLHSVWFFLVGTVPSFAKEIVDQVMELAAVGPGDSDESNLIYPFGNFVG